MRLEIAIYMTEDMRSGISDCGGAGTAFERPTRRRRRPLQQFRLCARLRHRAYFIGLTHFTRTVEKDTGLAGFS